MSNNGHGFLADAFRKFARKTSHVVGSSYAFAAAVLIIVAWAATYPLWQNGDTWQLVINTATTIVTFLMVFLIQNTQNRDTLQIHLKLDELIRAIGKAHNSMIDLEAFSDEELHALEKKFAHLREHRRRPKKHSADGDENSEQERPSGDSPIDEGQPQQVRHVASD